MQTSGFFDAMEVGNGQYDREYVAAQFAKYFSLFVGNGVFVQTANALQIVSAGDMNITMHAGAAFVNGYWYINDSDLMYTIPINTESTARYDSVVIAFDTVERTAEMRYKVNDISVDRQDELYELQIAQVVVNAGTVEITDAYIIDKRPDESVCGFVKGLVEVLTTNELFNQFNAQFVEWFDVIKGQLSEDAAGSLQLQVDERVLKSNVVKTAEEIENGTDEEKVAGILAIKGLLQKINNSINERVLKSKVLSQLALVMNATSEEEVAGALAVKELNSNVDELNQKTDNINVYVGEDKKLHFVDSAGADSVLPFSGGKYAKFTKFGTGNVGNGNGSTSSFTFTIPEDCDLIVFYITNTNAQNGASVAATGVFSFSGLSGDSKPTALSGTREYLVAIYNAKKGNTFSLHNIGQAYGATGSYRYAYGNDPN